MLLFLAVLGLYLSAPNVTNTDAYLAVPTAVSLVHSGNFDLDEFHSPLLRGHYGYVEIDGRHYDRYPWAPAMLAIPVVLVADVLAQVGIGREAASLVESNDMGPLQLVTASMVTALAALVVAVIAYERLRGSPTTRRRAALAVAAVFALGTSAWSTASRSLWQHGPSMLLLALAVLAAVRLEDGRRPRAMALVLGAAVAGAYAVRPTNAIAVAAFTLLVGLRHRRSALPYLAGLLGVLALFVAVNVAAYGEVLPHYFSARRISLHGDYLEALAANVVSPARGMLLFSPVVALSVAGVFIALRRRSAGPLHLVALGCVVAQLLVVSAQNEGWWAGHAYGPRFLSDVLPLLAYLSLPAVQALLDARPERAQRSGARVARVAVGVVVAVSIAINGEGAYLRASTCWNSVPVDVDVRPARVWDFGRPQLLAGFRSMVRDSPRTAMFGPCAEG